VKCLCGLCVVVVVVVIGLVLVIQTFNVNPSALIGVVSIDFSEHSGLSCLVL